MNVQSRMHKAQGGEYQGRENPGREMTDENMMHLATGPRGRPFRPPRAPQAPRAQRTSLATASATAEAHARHTGIARAAVTRTAALLTGEVDIVQDLSVRDVARVEREADYEVITRPSLLNLVLALDFRDQSPTIPLDTNPMQDQRVREAITRAIDVEAIRTAIMNGLSTPSEQYVPASHIGYLPGASFREMYPFDLERARELMEEAGYGDGFRMTLDATNNRYVNDQEIAQALAQMLSQIGIDLELNLMPRANFFGYIRVPSDQSSFIMSGWDVPSGDAGSMYGAMFHTRDVRDAYGRVNRGAYSNPEVDALIIEADSTADVRQRHETLQKVTEILMRDIPMIPVHYEQDIYAAHDRVQFTPRTDKFLWAYEMDVAE